MEGAIETFTTVTGKSADVAKRYLEMTENNAEQAIQLFYDSPDLISGDDPAPLPTAPLIPTSTRPHLPPMGISRDDADGLIQLDSDDDEEDMELDETYADPAVTHAAAVSVDYEDDEAIARRLQEELYAGGDASGGFDADGVRAPIARTTETLVGAPGGDWPPESMHDTVLQQMRTRRNRTIGAPGVFNQRAVSSIWDEGADENTRRQGMSEATGGASEWSAKSARLAELFRPPFELMSRLPWDTARDQGKEDKKWILVNVQDPSIFDCQQLNRDIWKDEGIKEVVKENFIFMQYDKDDPRGSQYIQYYFSARDSDAAYPHIAIVDPRTGEQVKVWSGPPLPKAGEFLMQLIEFLDRYSLDVTKKNPVARRKPEKAKSIDVDRLTEQEMLDLALQNSLVNNETAGPKEEDPDDLTKSFGDLSKGKEKAVEEDPSEESTNGHSLFSEILSNNPHVEPAAGPNVTRIQIRHSTGRIIRRFSIDDPVRRIYEWLKAEPLEGKEGLQFDLKSMGKDLVESLDTRIKDAGLMNGTVMVEYIED
ncbi:hypothetical protein B7494_g3265 [Chlorociboria aeruginascens]|nr:hypothetical protein B7494_g3265 [Chlorociboria aeruginascens]